MKHGKNFTLGEYVIIKKPELVEAGDNVRISDFCRISSACEIGSDCEIATGTYISGGDGKYKFNLFKADKICDGKDLTIFVSGLCTADAIQAKDMLKAEGISVEVINIHTIKPIDEEAIVKSAKKTKAVLTVENHNVIGGLYSAVTEVLAKNCPVKCDCIGIYDQFGEVGKIPQLKARYNMTVNDIVAKAKDLVKNK